MSDVKAYQIKEALASQHYKDFFVTECKNGPTYNPTGNGLLIFDAIAIAKSWSNPRIVIYEVKVSRNDFLRDGKYQCYLPYCHEFYFVVPKGMVKKEELPENVGLKYYDPNTKAIRTVKKAVYRHIELNPELFMYIIMNKLESDRYPFFHNKKEYAEAYLNEKNMRYDIGRKLGSKMATEIERLIQENDRLSKTKEDIELLQSILLTLKGHGISIWWKEDIPKKLEEALSRKYPKELDQIEQQIQNLQNYLVETKRKYEK